MTNREHEDPPGMWSGFNGRLPNLDAYAPRMGISHGMELSIPEDMDNYYQTHGEARSAGREAAWARYDQWQARAPEKSLSQFICDEALSEAPWLTFEQQKPDA